VVVVSKEETPWKALAGMNWHWAEFGVQKKDAIFRMLHRAERRQCDAGAQISA
jgi:hypothetical protein